MRNIGTIALNELRVFFADRSNLVGLVFFPVLMTVIIGGAVGSGSNINRLRVDVLDMDNTPESTRLIEAIRQANDTLYFCPQDAGDGFDCNLSNDGTLTPEVSKERVSHQDTNALIVIPAGYGEKLLKFEPVTLEYYSLANMTTGDIVLTALQAGIQRVNGAVVAARVGQNAGDEFNDDSIFRSEADRAEFTQTVYDQAAALLEEQPLTVSYTLAQVKPEDRPVVQTQGFGQSVPGMGTMFVMFTLLGMLPIFVKERKQWTLQRLVMMPVSRSEILGGKVIALFVLGMIQFGVVFVVGFITGTNFGDSPLAILLVMMAFVLCVTALTVALATRITTEGLANGMSFLLSMVLAPLGGAWWPSEIMPAFMQTLGRFSPVSWAMEGFRKVIFFGGGIPEVLPGVAVLVVASVVLFFIGVRGFRYE